MLRRGASIITSCRHLTAARHHRHSFSLVVSFVGSCWMICRCWGDSFSLPVRCWANTFCRRGRQCRNWRQSRNRAVVRVGRVSSQMVRVSIFDRGLSVNRKKLAGRSSSTCQTHRVKDTITFKGIVPERSTIELDHSIGRKVERNGTTFVDKVEIRQVHASFTNMHRNEIVVDGKGTGPNVSRDVVQITVAVSGGTNGIVPRSERLAAIARHRGRREVTGSTIVAHSKGLGGNASWLRLVCV